MDGRHLPCEMSVCEYSLSGGLSRLLHAFVRPPPSAVPVGVAYQIIRKAKDTHKLDLDVPPMQSAAASNYANVVRNLLGMISPEEVHLPPLYTLKVLDCSVQSFTPLAIDNSTTIHFILRTMWRRRRSYLKISSTGEVTPAQPPRT